MARKSRVNIEVKEINTIPKAERIPTAIYARLSVENSGKSEDKDVIRNQIEICKAYVEENPQFDLLETYIENGKTGTTFDRPQFNKLMEDIKSGKIKCLVVRDLSRFGRDYIETGTYLERIFPNIGLRFISIKENYDSFTVDHTNEALMIPLQNMINSLYSKDISRKVSSALNAEMEKGTFKTRNLPYGYMWGENKEVIIDEDTAPYIKLMFQWKIEGVSIYQICKRLNDMKAPSAEYHKYETGVKNGDCQRAVKWGNSTLYNILENPFYIGDTALKKTEKALYKDVKNHRIRDKGKWLVFSNTHEAIISREDFEKVKAMMEFASAERQRKMAETDKIRATMVDLFAGKLFCADCGKKLYYKRNKLDYKDCKVKKDVWCPSYDCSTNVRRLTPKCTPHHIQQNHLNEKVLSAIQTQVKVAINYEKLLLKLKDSEGEKSIRDKQNALISSLNLKLNGVQKKRTRLYEDFSEGILTEEEYIFAKSSYDDNFAKLNLQLEEAIDRRMKFNDAMSSNNKWIQLMKSVSKAKKLTQALVDESIERVLVHEGGDIELTMKYADIYTLTVACVKEIEKEDKVI